MPAPAWIDLPGTDGKKHSLADLKDKPVVVVVFTCNSCPVGRTYEDRIIEFAKKHAAPDSKVALVAINVNTIEEDRLPKMQERAKEKGFPFLYLFDESQRIARDFGAMYTPEFFVIDKDRKIAYMGANGRKGAAGGGRQIVFGRRGRGGARRQETARQRDARSRLPHPLRPQALNRQHARDTDRRPREWRVRANSEICGTSDRTAGALPRPELENEPAPRREMRQAHPAINRRMTSAPRRRRRAPHAARDRARRRRARQSLPSECRADC